MYTATYPPSHKLSKYDEQDIQSIIDEEGTISKMTFLLWFLDIDVQGLAEPQGLKYVISVQTVNAV